MTHALYARFSVGLVRRGRAGEPGEGKDAAVVKLTLLYEDGRAEVVEVEGNMPIKDFRKLVKVCTHVRGLKRV